MFNICITNKKYKEYKYSKRFKKKNVDTYEKNFNLNKNTDYISYYKLTDMKHTKISPLNKLL
jgi:hypothetical protein